MLHYNRTLAVNKNYTPWIENTSWKFWKMAMLKRSLMDMASPKMKTKIVHSLFKNSWAKHRSELIFEKSFKEQWKERENNKLNGK